MAYKVELMSGEVFYTSTARCDTANRRWIFDIYNDNWYVRNIGMDNDGTDKDIVKYVQCYHQENDLISDLNDCLSDLRKLDKVDYDKLEKRYKNLLLCLQSLEFDLQDYINQLYLYSDWHKDFTCTLLAEIKEAINEQGKS